MSAFTDINCAYPRYHKNVLDCDTTSVRPDAPYRDLIAAGVLPTSVWHSDPMSDPRVDGLRSAIRVMTAWAEGDTQPGFMADQVVAMTLHESTDRLAAWTELGSGLSNLCGVRLMHGETTTGATPQETLQAVARSIEAKR